MIRSHWSAKYCLIPLYIYSWWSIFNYLGGIFTLIPSLVVLENFVDRERRINFLYCSLPRCSLLLRYRYLLLNGHGDIVLLGL